MRCFASSFRLPAKCKRPTDPDIKVSHACTFLQDAYFQQTSRVQKMVLPFQIVTNDTSLCQPGIQERSADIEGKCLLKLPRAHSAHSPPAYLASLRGSCLPASVPVDNNLRAAHVAKHSSTETLLLVAVCAC